MNLTAKAIERPRLVLLGTLLILAIGVGAVLRLPKERAPRIKIPIVLVAIANPGATPVSNERDILRRVEEQSGALSDLKADGGIISQSMHGAAVIQFVFEDHVDPQEARRDVESMINRIKGEFPADAQSDPGPIVDDIAFEDMPVIQAYVAGGSGPVERRRVAERLQQRIESVAGVAGADLFGGDEPEIHIEIDPHLMTLYGFSYGDVYQAVTNANVDAPSGEITGEGGRVNRVQTRAKFQSLDEIRQVPLGVRDGSPITLADVAEVSLAAKPRSSIARFDGEDAVVVLARAKTDIDMLAAANAIQAEVDRFAAQEAPPGVRIGTGRSQATEISYMIEQLGSSAIYGTMVVLTLLVIAMGWRMAGLIGLAIPFAILATAALMWMGKLTVMDDLAINSMVLFGLILIIGMVVDGCIIVGENIYRHRELGRSPLDAAKQGIAEVDLSLVSAYLTTFAAFVPMFLVRGIMGDFMRVLPIVVMFALAAAVLVDHFLLPTLSVYLMKPKRIDPVVTEDGTPPSPEELEVRGAERAAQRGVVVRTYGRMLGYSLKHRGLVLVLTLMTALTPVGLAGAGLIGMEFFPDGDVPIVEVKFELPLGSDMEKRTAAVAAEVEAAVMRAVRPEEWYRATPASAPARPVTTMGEAEALSIRLDQFHGPGPEYGITYVELALAEARERSAAEIRDAIRSELPPMPGVIVKVETPQEGPPVGSPVALRVLGRKQASLEELGAFADRVQRLLSETPGTMDVTSDFRLRPETVVEPHDVLTRMFDVDKRTVAESIRFALEGVKAGEVDFGGDEAIDLRIRNQSSMRDDLADLRSLPLLKQHGEGRIELAQIAEPRRVDSANVIRRHDQQRVINIRSDLDEGVLIDDVKGALIAGLRPELSDREAWRLSRERGEKVIFADENFLVEFGGETELRDDAIADLTLAMLVALGLMLIILVLKFNSFIQPLILLFSVPLSLVGVTFGLILCGLNFSVSAMIGVVALSGVVVNDAIVLVDFINRLRASGLPIDKAVTYAGQLRLRPIFLTTVTTIGGLLPLGLNLAGGGEFWQPLTVSIMFGLAFATLQQLFVIPLAIYTLDRGRGDSLLDPARHRRLSAEAAPSPASLGGMAPARVADGPAVA